MLIRALVLTPAQVLRRLQRLVPPEVATLFSAPRAGAAEAVSSADYDLLVVERERAGKRPAELFERLRALPGAPEAIVLCDREDSVDRASLLAAGCMAVLDHALDDGTLGETLCALVARRREAVIERGRTRRDNGRRSLAEFVSESHAMRGFLGTARKVVDSDVSLLILGETGVGKERLARAMHDEGPRRDGPFIAVNCAALPENLLESELFGHEEGAFTGAVRARRGYFELAHGGTLFLDEIGEIPSSLQVKLLRALQERRVQRLGSERELAVDVRMIAATNRDLAAEVTQGRFRADLYYRIAVVTLAIPPLRERREDIPALIAVHLETLGARFGKRGLQIADDARRALQDYSWPGNVRELVNVLERAVLLCEGEAVGLADLPESLASCADAVAPVAEHGHAVAVVLPYSAAVDRVVRAFELDYFTRLLRRTGGRIGETARLADISPRALYEKLARLGLRKEEFRRHAPTL